MPDNPERGTWRQRFNQRATGSDIDSITGAPTDDAGLASLRMRFDTGGVYRKFAAGAANWIESHDEIPTLATYDLITGWKAESIPRMLAQTDQVTLVSGTMVVSRVYMAAGTVVSNLSFVTGGTGATGPTNQWLGLYDVNRVQLATTSDGGSGAIGTFTVFTRPIATVAAGAASNFTTTYSGWHYVGVNVTCSGTAPKLYGLPSNPPMNTAPGLGGTSNSSLTGPIAFPVTLTAVTFIGSPLAYLGVS